MKRTTWNLLSLIVICFCAACNNDDVITLSKNSEVVVNNGRAKFNSVEQLGSFMSNAKNSSS